ncbi:MAG: prepilin-type N-terminal cleavage/methylation domain-containing protein [Oceanicaulis sp.]
MTAPARSEAGFTLVEVLVAVGLFALIAAAGLALLDTVARVHGGTQGRLDRLASLQRAGALFTEDVSALSEGRVSGGEGVLSFERLTRNGAPVQVGYRHQDGALVREIAGQAQTLLQPAGPARFRVFTGGAWRPVEGLDRDADIALVEIIVAAPDQADTVLMRRVVRPPDGTRP